ncbi:hypothetical protein [Kordiimonas sp.]|uniref:hypothetical protein n=1 Tax=Kordiimonas sp. TaxID=1970157 RepID=UPI003A90CEA6
MPKDFTTIEDATERLEAIAAAIDEDGLVWLPYVRTPAKAIYRQIEELLPHKSLYMASPAPDWDHVIIETDRLPDWMTWLEQHAHTRYALKEQGLGEHLLPPLPRNITPLTDEDRY